MRIATVFGGSGFLGRYITRRLAKEGWSVRVAVRRPNEALFVRTYGAVGQVEPILANIRDEGSTYSAIKGAELVVNSVGILTETRKQKFQAVQAKAAERIARLSAELKVKRLIHISAIGADASSQSLYAQSKAQGEASVREHFEHAVILRPSIIFGVEDQFFNRFAAMARISPALPLIGAETKFQPVYVDDVAKAVLRVAKGEASSPLYELGGPEVKNFAELMEQMLNIIRRKRLILPLPNAIGYALAGGFSLLDTLSFGLFPNNMLTFDQIKQLGNDNTTSKTTPGFKELDITPTALDAILPHYLYMYRAQGQYTEMTDAAKSRKL